MNDSDRAWEAWKLFCNGGDDSASYGFYILKELADKGNARAQHYLGAAYNESRAGVALEKLLLKMTQHRKVF